MIDLHTHILPNIDDGSRSLDESISLLNGAKNLGITSIALTPHYYSDTESIEDFCVRRNASFQNLIKASQDDIKLLKGAEVYVTDYLFYQKKMTALLIENTPYMLVEFDVDIKKDNLARWLENFKSLNIRMIVAHAERYVKLQKIAKLFKSFNCLISVNFESFLDKTYLKNINYLLEHNLIDILSSDAHNVKKRNYPTTEEYERIKKHIGEKKMLHINNCENKFLGYLN